MTIQPDGRWAQSTVGTLISRQNGKTHMMRMRILAGLYIVGEQQIIGMAQNRQLALDTLKSVVDYAESLSWMRKRIKRVSRTNGQEELEVYCHHWPKDCGGKCARIRKYAVRAATSEGPRGSSADLLYIDELREIRPEAWSAAQPLTRARPNAQLWITSNAGDATSTVLNDIRQRAMLNVNPRLGWYEWSAEPKLAIDDVRGWKQANPALGHLITLETLQDAFATSTADAFRTESLCQWIDAIDSPWPMGAWNDSGNDLLGLEKGLETYMGIDLTFDRTQAFLVTVQLKDNEFRAFLTQWVKDSPISDIELASDVAALARTYNARAVAFDPNTAGYIAPHLARVGVPVAPTPWGSAQFAIFCDQTLSAMNQKTIRHANQELLHTHLIACARRPASDGGWRIARRAAQVPISGAVALVMAMGHAATPRASVGVSVV